MPPNIPANAIAAVDQQYTDVKNLLAIMLAGVRQQIDDGADEAVAWAGTVQAVLKEGEEDPEYIGKMIQLSVAAVIRLAKRERE